MINQPTISPYQKQKAIQPCLKEIPVEDNKCVQVRPSLLNQIFSVFYLSVKKNEKGRFHKQLQEFHAKYIMDPRTQQSFYLDFKKMNWIKKAMQLHLSREKETVNWQVEGTLI